MLTAAPLTSASVSILARDPITGDLGMAAASHAPACGAAIPWGRPDVGAAAVQAWTDPLMGDRLLQLLSEGMAPRDVLARVLGEDRAPERRQIALIDARGACVTHSGREIPPQAAALEGAGFCVQGNDLPSPAVAQAMAASYRDAAARGAALAESLLEALEAAAPLDAPSGSLRSAALRVVTSDPRRRRNPGSDLRVDDDDHPVAALRALSDRIAGRLGHRDLARPSGADVRELQRLLRQVGLYDREPSGLFDDATASAVLAFRRAQGLADGDRRGKSALVDPELLARLRAAASSGR